MVNKIKIRLDKEMPGFVRQIDETYSLKKSSPLLFKHIKSFVLRPGKRIRPLFFLIGYLGFAKKPAARLYSTALSIELLHDFILVHDDIIDRSNMRRGKLSMHAMLNNYLAKYKKPKFNGQDLAMIAGDIMYATGIGSFLSIKEKPQYKEKALIALTKSAVYTGNGEFLELISQLKNIEKIKKKDIYKIYDLKTAYYSFATPLSAGAILAGAAESESSILFKYGVCLGRAFQIYDDLIDILSDSYKTGKPNFTDLQESKKTILIWYAYKNSGNKNKNLLKKLLGKPHLTSQELMKILGIIKAAKTINYAKTQINLLLGQAKIIIKRSKIKPDYKNILTEHPKEIILPENF